MREFSQDSLLPVQLSSPLGNIVKDGRTLIQDCVTDLPQPSKGRPEVVELVHHLCSKENVYGGKSETGLGFLSGQGVVEEGDREVPGGCNDVEKDPKNPSMEGNGKEGNRQDEEERSNQQAVPCSRNVTAFASLPGGEVEAADPVVEGVVERQGEQGGDQVDQKSNSTTLMSAINLHVVILGGSSQRDAQQSFRLLVKFIVGHGLR